MQSNKKGLSLKRKDPPTATFSVKQNKGIQKELR
jgi:hypothetical protein